MPSLVLVFALGLMVIGFVIAACCFKHPAAKIFGGLAIGVGLCAVAMGIVYAGCMLMMKGL